MHNYINQLTNSESEYRLQTFDSLTTFPQSKTLEALLSVNALKFHIPVRVPCRCWTEVAVRHAMEYLWAKNTIEQWSFDKLHNHCLESLALTKWKSPKVSCLSLLGFIPSIFLKSCTSPPRKCGFEAIIGAFMHVSKSKVPFGGHKSGSRQKQTGAWLF